MYIRRLSDAFGWKFIFICCATYGANQVLLMKTEPLLVTILINGIGVEWGTFAMKYYFADTLKVSPARAAALRGFVRNDAGYDPYHGMLSWGALFLVPMTPIAAVFFLIIANYGIASPDVAVDAAVAERAKTHPELAPDMQAASSSYCRFYAVAPAVWLFLRRVSPVLAKASTFIFLREALQPSTSVLFYWYRRTEENCKKGYPCLDPEFIGLMDAVAYVFLLCGTIVYQKFFSKWTYRGIFILAQVLLVGFNLLDLIWVTRLNVKLGISDKVFGPILMRLALMPMLILSAKLCPPGVEATLFALNMGLSNFGVSVGRYLGVFCLEMFGGIEGPEFKNLQWFVLLRSEELAKRKERRRDEGRGGTPTDDARAISERNGGDCGGSDVRESKESQESSISLEDIGHGDRKKGWRRVDSQESLEIVDDEDE
eukprot:jgi/Bigna1/141201/aug1.61_g15909